MSQHSSLTAAALFSAIAFSACGSNDALYGTVVAAGADAEHIKIGRFPFDGNNDMSFFAGPDGRVVPTSYSSDTVTWTPDRIDKESVGSVIFDVYADAPKKSADAVFIVWSDVDDDGKLDLSLVGESETARLIYRMDETTNFKTFMTSYTYYPNSGNPYFNPNGVDEKGGFVFMSSYDDTGWMAVLSTDTEPPVVYE